MLFRLFLLFTLVPLADLTILVWIAQHTGWMVTLALIFLPGMLGAWLARREGIRCLRAVRAQLGQGQMPANPLLEGLLVLIAGALLITPGLITDLTGLLLLIPPIRRMVRRYVTHRLRARIVSIIPGRPFSGDRIIDVRVVPPKDRPGEHGQTVDEG